eukprot:COSAG01_NODE_8380_length_2807_cov_3.481905_5_plen_55_part_00
MLADAVARQSGCRGPLADAGGQRRSGEGAAQREGVRVPGCWWRSSSLQRGELGV